MSKLWVPEEWRRRNEAKQLARERMAAALQPIYDADPTEAEKATDHVFNEVNRVMDAEQKWVDNCMKRIMPGEIYEKRYSEPTVVARWLMERDVRIQQPSGLVRILMWKVDGVDTQIARFEVKPQKGRKLGT